jgi:hypothetical protein
VKHNPLWHDGTAVQFLLFFLLLLSLPWLHREGELEYQDQIMILVPLRIKKPYINTFQERGGHGTDLEKVVINVEPHVFELKVPRMGRRCKAWSGYTCNAILSSASSTRSHFLDDAATAAGNLADSNS